MNGNNAETPKTVTLPLRAKKQSRRPKTRALATRLGWTPERYLAARQQSARGDHRAIGMLSRVVLSDDRAIAAVAQRIDSMFAQEVRFEPAINMPVSFWRECPEQELKKMLRYGIVTGFCWGRFTREPSGEVTFEAWLPERFRQVDRFSRWEVETEEGWLPLDSTWRGFFPYGRRDATAEALIHALAIPFISKTTAVDDRNTKGEIRDLLHAKQGDSRPEDRDKLRDDLESADEDPILVTDEHVTLSLVSRQNSGNMSREQETIDWADSAITLAMLAQTITTEGAAGFSSGTPQMSVLATVVKSQEVSFSTFAGKEVLTPWLEMRAPSVIAQALSIAPECGGHVFPRWSVDMAEDAKDDMTKTREQWDSFNSTLSGLRENGLPLNPHIVEAIARAYGLESFPIPLPPKKEDDVIPPQS